MEYISTTHSPESKRLLKQMEQGYKKREQKWLDKLDQEETRAKRARSETKQRKPKTKPKSKQKGKAK
jgi:hypothetical protein